MNKASVSHRQRAGFKERVPNTLFVVGVQCQFKPVEWSESARAVLQVLDGEVPGIRAVYPVRAM